MTTAPNYITSTTPTNGQQHPLLAVLSTLSYFEIFRYPVTAQEIIAFSNSLAINIENLPIVLRNGITSGQIFQFGEYFQTINDPSWMTNRHDLNKRAGQYLPIAHRMGRLIGYFPFVRAVMVSGSLSKNAMPADGDIDFFIITNPGRLWFARTTLVLFKKICLLNSRKYFCVNYFIDTDHLEIEEKNLFTATECATLLPVYGAEWYDCFVGANGWVKNDFFPHFSSRNTENIPKDQPGILKRGMEFIFNTQLGAMLDRVAMRVTLWFWRRKFKYFDANKFDLALKSRTYVSKHHPLSFQEKVLARHQALMTERSAANDKAV